MEIKISLYSSPHNSRKYNGFKTVPRAGLAKGYARREEKGRQDEQGGS